MMGGGMLGLGLGIVVLGGLEGGCSSCVCYAGGHVKCEMV
jgi:hypothetical protein